MNKELIERICETCDGCEFCDNYPELSEQIVRIMQTYPKLNISDKARIIAQLQKAGEK